MGDAFKNGRVTKITLEMDGGFKYEFEPDDCVWMHRNGVAKGINQYHHMEKRLNGMQRLELIATVGCMVEHYQDEIDLGFKYVGR